MAIDGYFINQQIKEFSPLLMGKVRKIYSPSKYQIILSIYNKGNTYNLLFDISPNSAHFRLINNPVNKTEHFFVDILKRHLLNTTLNNIKQHQKDRIIFISFLKHDPFTGIKQYELVFEIMGRNTNLILIDNNKTIIEAFNKRFNDDKRSIIPNIIYEVFPTNKKVFSSDDFKTTINADQLFYNYMGFSKDLANYVFNHKIDPLDIKVEPTLYKNKKTYFHFFDLKLNGTKTSFNDTSSLLNYYYSITLKSDDFIEKILNKELTKQQQKLITLTEQLATNQNFNKYKQIADEIYSSGINLQEKHSSFNSYQLNFKLTLNENAQKLYQKYKKLKASIAHLNKQLLITNNLIAYLTDYLLIYPTLEPNDLILLKEELIALNIIRQKKKKKIQTKKTYFQQFNLAEATCLVGKTLKQNEYIYNKASKDDLWFHIKDYPGAHVILKGKKDDQNILFAAQQALINSPLNNQKSGEVIYTYKKNTKRISNKPGFYLTYSNEKSLKITLN